MSEDDGGNVGVLDPLVDEADASVVDSHDCIVAFRCHVFNKGIGVVI